MKLVYSIFTLTFIILSSCNKKAEKSVQNLEKPKMLVDKKTVYEFLNYNLSSENYIFKNCKSVLNRDPLPYFSESDSIAITKMDSIFSRKDIDFIFKQSKFSKYFSIEKEYLKGIEIVELDTIKAFSNDKLIRNAYWYETNNKYFNLCTTNIPLFSLDKQIAIIKIGCDSQWGTFVYRKENGKWKLIATISSAIA